MAQDKASAFKSGHRYAVVVSGRVSAYAKTMAAADKLAKPVDGKVYKMRAEGGSVTLAADVSPLRRNPKGKAKAKAKPKAKRRNPPPTRQGNVWSAEDGPAPTSGLKVSKVVVTATKNPKGHKRGCKCVVCGRTSKPKRNPREPKPKFKRGDRVCDLNGGRPGEVWSIYPNYQGEEYGGWRYLVKEDNGAKIYHNETNTRRIAKPKRVKK